MDVNEDQIVFLKGETPQWAIDITASVPDTMDSVPWSDEIYIDGGVDEVRLVSDSSCTQVFGIPSYDLIGDRATVLRVDYWTLVMDEEFDPGQPEKCELRKQRIYALTDVLEKGNLVGYGLGPEYGLLAWSERESRVGSAKDLDLTESQLSTIADQIFNEHATEIEEWYIPDFKDVGELEALIDPGLPRQIYDQIMKILEDAIIRDRDESEKESRRQQALESIKTIADVRFDSEFIIIREQNEFPHLSATSRDLQHILLAQIGYKDKELVAHLSIGRKASPGHPYTKNLANAELVLPVEPIRSEVIALLNQKLLSGDLSRYLEKQCTTQN